MEITFLIGNGFDVGMGLKSKFTDYFPLYCSESLHKEERLKGLSKSILDDKEEWSYFERQLGEYTEKFDSNTVQDYINQEKDFLDGFIKYLEKEESKLSFDDKPGIARMMTQALINYYTNDNLQRESETTIKNLYFENRSATHNYNFISFNYTSVLEKCLQTINRGIIKDSRPGSSEAVTIGKIANIEHVHGSINNYPIIGVNDKSQIKNSELAEDKRFQRRIVKPAINEIIRMNYDSRCSNIINKSTIICVYGMSLGETDRKWWDTILIWLSKSSKRQLVIFDYDEEYVTSSPFAWIEKEEEILDKLTSYSLNKMNAENYRSQIHIAVHKNIFQIDLMGKYNQSMSGAIDSLVLALNGVKP